MSNTKFALSVDVTFADVAKMFQKLQEEGHKTEEIMSMKIDLKRGIEK